MRALLFTGKGGVGKTTMAAATAVHTSRRGLKTLALSTDPAHSLGDAFGVALTDVPTEVEPGLYALHVDTQRAFEIGWREISGYLQTLLAQGGIAPFEAEELTVLPGAEELLALLELRNQARDGRWDVIVVDCAPTGETLRLLALPDALSWWVRRLFPADRRVAKALRPVVAGLVGLPLPPDEVFVAAERLCGELAEVRDLLTDAATTSIRLVLTPEALVLAEARRAATSLSLFGYRVDGVIVNRVFPPPPHGGQDWVSAWAKAQAGRMEQITASFPGLPRWQVAHAAAEPIGLDALADLAVTAYDGTDPLAVTATTDPLTVERVASDEFVLSLSLPHAAPGEIHLARKADDLLVTVAGWRRVLALPSALRRCVVDGAGLVDGRLLVRFRADPDLWMRA
jgi:arsenite-transporting ATPase